MAPRNVSFVGVPISIEKSKEKDYFDRRGIAPYLQESFPDREALPSSREGINAAPGASNIAGEADAAAGTSSSVLKRVSSLSILRASASPHRPPEPSPKPEPPEPEVAAVPEVQPTWRRSPERMKTAGVGLIMSLNIGTDPPDVTKPHNCAKLQCWVDPSTMRRANAKTVIGEKLEAQYARWQLQRAAVPVKYKHLPDPTVEDVRAMCHWLRRQARSDRVLLHYNGHGVPRPTVSGEIWVFDRDHTQYIPLIVTDLRQWLGKPSIVVLDCSNAGVLIPSLTAPLEGSEDASPASTPPQSRASSRAASPFAGPDMEATASQMVRDTLVLCATSEGELLPMHPDYPADIFTSCLTTPIETALRFFIRKNPQSMGDLDPDVVDHIPGTRGDRKTPIGELTWIFGAVTDCIAWNVFPRSLFQRLFRQDHMLAGIFRNFLLADRVLRTLNCTPKSYPPLPPGVHVHPLWEAWDLACETCLSALVRDGVIGNHLLNPRAQPTTTDGDQNESVDSPRAPSEPCETNPPTASVSGLSLPFFAEQLSAFEVWLEFAAINKVDQTYFEGDDPYDPPEQLPIVLQALLSPAHRVRALNLLRRFLELGPWAVNVALCLGSQPYVLKLLQAPEYKRDLVAIWSRILHFDPSCQQDLVRDGVLSHFVNHLKWGLSEGPENAVLVSPEEGGYQRSMAAFILSATCLNYHHGQHDCIRYNVHGICCSLLASIEVSNETSVPDPDHDARVSISEQRLPPLFRMWLCICLGNLVKENKVVQGEAYGVGAHRRLFARIEDDSHDVRAAACYALGCLIAMSTDAQTPATNKETHVAAGTVSVPLGGGAVLPAALIPNRLVGTAHQGTGLVAPAIAGVVPRQFQPSFLAGQPVRPQNLHWQPQHLSSGTTGPSLPVRLAPMASGLNAPGPGGGVGLSAGTSLNNSSPASPPPLSSSVFQDTKRIALDLNVIEELLKVLGDASPMVRYECVISLGRFVEKYLAAFLAVADSSGNSVEPESQDSDQVSELPDRNGVIPLPQEVRPDLLAKLTSTWQAIRKSHRHDAHPAVSNAATAIVSVVCEKVLIINKAVERSVHDTDVGGVKRIHSDIQMGSLDEAAPLEDVEVPRRLAVAPTEHSEQASLRRISSEHHVLPKGTGKLERSRSGTRLTSGDVLSMLSDSSGQKMEYSFPESKFYEWKKTSFAEIHGDNGDAILEELDPLTLEGAAASYRKQRNKKAHEYSMKVSSNFSSLAASPSRPKRHRYEFVPSEDEEVKRQANQDLADKKLELRLKHTGLLRETDSSVSSLLSFHPYENALVACDVNGGISVWDYQKVARQLLFRNGNPKGTRMTSGGWINETSKSLFMVGCEDGSVRIWDGILERNGRVSTSSPTLSTSFFAVPDMTVDNSLSGLILEWQQYSGRLIAGGNSSALWCWDLAVDKPSTVIQTGSSACITSLDTAWRTDSDASSAGDSRLTGPDIIVAGQSDGLIKLFDLRSNRAAAELGSGRPPVRGRAGRMQFDEHRAWVVGASCTTYGGRNEIVSASTDGVIKVWDFRVSASMKTYNVQRSALTMLAVHPKIPILATGSPAQFIKVVSLVDGDDFQTLVDDGHRIGPVTRLAFHPYKPILAAADQEMVVSLYTPKDPKWR